MNRPRSGLPAEQGATEGAFVAGLALFFLRHRCRPSIMWLEPPLPGTRRGVIRPGSGLILSEARRELDKGDFRGRSRRRVKDIYDSLKRPNRNVGNIVQVFSLRPDLLKARGQFAQAMTFGGSGLGRRTEELIATSKPSGTLGLPTKTSCP